MRIWGDRSRPKRNNMDIKKTVQTWLEKLISPARETNAEKIKSHFHRVEGTTSRAKGHIESVILYTGKPVAAKAGHVHQYSGTVLSDGESHDVEGVTGLAMITGKDHYHEISGRTTKDGSHSHKFMIDSSGAMRNKKQLQHKSVCTRLAHSLPVRAAKEEETEQ